MKTRHLTIAMLLGFISLLFLSCEEEEKYTVYVYDRIQWVYEVDYAMDTVINIDTTIINRIETTNRDTILRKDYCGLYKGNLRSISVRFACISEYVAYEKGIDPKILPHKR